MISVPGSRESLGCRATGRLGTRGELCNRSHGVYCWLSLLIRCVTGADSPNVRAFLKRPRHGASEPGSRRDHPGVPKAPIYKFCAYP